MFEIKFFFLILSEVVISLIDLSVHVIDREIVAQD